MEEIYKPIPGYENLYEASNLGNVRSVKGGRRSGKVLKEFMHAIKYKRVSLCKNGKTRNMTVHRCVALAHIPNPENKRTVNHKDMNPSNNHVSNLEWATHSENEQHSRSHGKRSWNNGRRGIQAHFTRKEGLMKLAALKAELKEIEL